MMSVQISEANYTPLLFMAENVPAAALPFLGESTPAPNAETKLDIRLDVMFADLDMDAREAPLPVKSE